MPAAIFFMICFLLTTGGCKQRRAVQRTEAKSVDNLPTVFSCGDDGCSGGECQTSNVATPTTNPGLQLTEGEPRSGEELREERELWSPYFPRYGDEYRLPLNWNVRRYRSVLSDVDDSVLRHSSENHVPIYMRGLLNAIDNISLLRDGHRIFEPEEIIEQYSATDAGIAEIVDSCRSAPGFYRKLNCVSWQTQMYMLDRGHWNAEYLNSGDRFRPRGPCKWYTGTFVKALRRVLDTPPGPYNPAAVSRTRPTVMAYNYATHALALVILRDEPFGLNHGFSVDPTNDHGISHLHWGGSISTIDGRSASRPTHLPYLGRSRGVRCFLSLFEERNARSATQRVYSAAITIMDQNGRVLQEGSEYAISDHGVKDASEIDEMAVFLSITSVTPETEASQPGHSLGMKQWVETDQLSLPVYFSETNPEFSYRIQARILNSGHIIDPASQEEQVLGTCENVFHVNRADR